MCVATPRARPNASRTRNWDGTGRGTRSGTRTCSPPEHYELQTISDLFWLYFYAKDSSDIITTRFRIPPGETLGITLTEQYSRILPSCVHSVGKISKSSPCASDPRLRAGCIILCINDEVGYLFLNAVLVWAAKTKGVRAQDFAQIIAFLLYVIRMYIVSRQKRPKLLSTLSFMEKSH
jgi:hypothetical protein